MAQLNSRREFSLIIQLVQVPCVQSIEAQKQDYKDLNWPDTGSGQAEQKLHKRQDQAGELAHLSEALQVREPESVDAAGIDRRISALPGEVP